MTVKNQRLSQRKRTGRIEPIRAAEVSESYLHSQVVKRSVRIGSHKTSVSLEEAFWIELHSIAHVLGVYLTQLVGSIDAQRRHNNLSSSIRLFVLDYRSHHASKRPMSPMTQAVLADLKDRPPTH